MIYNYISNGRIAARKTDDTQKFVIDLSVAQAFVRARLEKDVRKAAEVQEELEGLASA